MIEINCPPNNMSVNIPLVVDLDGTLVNGDMLHESALVVFRQNPFVFLVALFKLLKGRAKLKRFLSKRFIFDSAILPYNQLFLEWLKIQNEQGRRLILCTASDEVIAQKIANYLGIFEEVIASDGVQNLASERKAKILVERFGRRGFDYAGNSHVDIPVWECSRRGIVVNAPISVKCGAGEVCELEASWPNPDQPFYAWVRAIRVHQWLKNLLILVPIFASHNLDSPTIWLYLIMAFIAFGLCASGVYVANDLFDLESDRQHPRKKNRAFASGQLSILGGSILAPVLIISGFAVATQVNSQFIFWLAIYLALTIGYSWGLKKLVLIDCIILAILYTLRIVAGAAAVAMALSLWLLAFSIFLFLSLAFIKRYAELEVQILRGKEKLYGRGYLTSDASLIQSLGVSAGYASVLVLSLYLNSEAVVALYKNPALIWGEVPVILFWISWMWMKAHRGQMHDDPLIFSVKDKVSLFSGLVFAIILILASRSLDW